MAELFTARVLKVEEAKKAKIVEFNLGNKKGVGAERGGLSSSTRDLAMRP